MIHPPKLSHRFFRWYCHRDYLEDIEGDLLERFEYNLEQNGSKNARWNFTKDVIKLFRPGLIRSLEGTQKLNNYGMFKNYLKVAFRNIKRQRVTSILNIIGLALGIASSLLIMLHIKQELNYENSYSKVEQIHRISGSQWANSSPPLKNFLQSNLPEAELVSQIAPFGTEIVRTETYKGEVENGYYADAAFFEIFDIKTLKGHPEKSINKPFKVILTKSMAKQFFGDKNPVGDVVIFDDKWDYEIIGVVEDLPKNSHIKIDYFVTMPTFYRLIPEDWTSNRGWMVTYNYVLLNNNATASEVNDKLKNLTYDFLSETPKEIVDEHNAHLQAYPIQSIHLHSHKEEEMSVNSDISTIYIFAALALFIILIACVNFINIFTAQAIKRAREVGVRKVLGAQRRQLIFQFLSESFLLVLIATATGLMLVAVCLPQYNQLVTLHLSFYELFTVENLQIIGSLVLFIGFLSGLYPAFYVSRQQTVTALKSDKNPKSSGAILRKILVVFQYSIAVIMLVGTSVIYLQMQYIDDKDLGFNKEQVLGVKLYGEFRNYIRENWETFHAELTAHSDIQSAALASNLAGERLSVEYLTPVGSESEELPSVRVMRVDEHYLNTMGIDIVDGHNFTPGNDSLSAFILNNKAVEVLGLTNPIGTVAENSTRQQKGKIVGVIDNFHFSSLHQQVEPLVLEYQPGWTSKIIVKLQTKNMRKTLETIESEVKRVSPETLVDYEFLDTKIEKLYEAESNMSKIINAFAILAIFISGLGLFGLMIYTIQMRTKEVGIRKVLGASNLKIVSVLTADFTRLVLIAILIAVPASYVLMEKWLNNFAYKLELQWWMFTGAGIVTLIITWLTIGFQTFKAATSSPVKSLRDE